MTARAKAMETAGKRITSRSNWTQRPAETLNRHPQWDLPSNGFGAPHSETFGTLVFSRSVMEKMLPPKIVKNILGAIEGREKLNPDHAEPIAIAMKEWAMSHGATHYCHWFQPLTGATAEKHDSFIEWAGPDGVIEKFGGKQLIQGEPDASSFPSGGLRCTYEARGYTGWDPSTPVFLWSGGDGLTLFVPSVFFSWTGDLLDHKIPLLRSEQRINEACLRLLKLTGSEASQVFSTLGWEQEYFVIDRALRDLRPDLVLAGRTVFGAPSPKGQEMQDHYFGAVKDRILAYMRDFEDECLKLGIPVKTRHNEVAPAQHEVAPVFEKASLAVDHNIMLMELMRQVAQKHGLCALLHEKPFHDLNGSGKHNNWSLSTDTGDNLLEPGQCPGKNLRFLILLTAVVAAVHKHEALIRASVASAGNDFRLGGHEAPPAIISLYLGERLEQVLEGIEASGLNSEGEGQSSFDLGVSVIPELPKDYTDRNRTSPFAFTGNKFEFRAVGSSATCALPITVLNVAVAESLEEIVNEIEASAGVEPSRQVLVDAAIPVLQSYLKRSKAIRFCGDNYSEEWEKEAEVRGLSNLKKSPYAFEAWVSDSTTKLFQGVLNAHELRSRYEIMQETYVHTVAMEARLMVELFRTQILPAALSYQKDLAKSLRLLKEVLGEDSEPQRSVLITVSQAISAAITALDGVEAELRESEGMGHREAAYRMADHLRPACEKARKAVDFLETWMEDDRWPLPKYRELLFMV